MAWSVPADPVAGGSITAARIAQILADLRIIGGVWSTYTPTLTGVTIGNGTLSGRFVQTGQTVRFQIQFTFGSTSAMTAAVTATLPATAKATDWQIDAVILDTSAGQYFAAFGICQTVTTINLRVPGTTSQGAFVNTGSAVPMTWATGDRFTILGIYEAA
jgi:hypothetical protein